MRPGKNLSRSNQYKVREELITRDWLAIDRTRMANERTFLAYFRTFIVILGSGVAILRVEMLENLFDLGVFLLIVAPVVLVIGIARFIYVKRHIRKYHTVKAPEE